MNLLPAAEAAAAAAVVVVAMLLLHFRPITTERCASIASAVVVLRFIVRLALFFLRSCCYLWISGTDGGTTPIRHSLVTGGTERPIFVVCVVIHFY